MSMEALEDEFCDVLSKATRGQGLSPVDLARDVNAAPLDLAQWLRGPAVPEDSIIERLAQRLQLNPLCFMASAHKSWHPQVELPSNVISYHQTPHVSNGYVFSKNGDVAVVDPAGNPQHALAAIKSFGDSLRYILITHRHDDHCDAAIPLLQAFPDAILLISAVELAATPELAPYATLVQHGEQHPFGDGIITVYFLPGHTDGLVCYQWSNFVAVGDALFAGSIGRNFGPQTTYHEQRNNLQRFLSEQKSTDVVLPGHGPPTTIDLERHHNPFLAVFQN
jgi:hydroxyacylglutathione hydrolase